jgi:hypothetical protein
MVLSANKPEAANKTMNIAGNESVGSDDYMDALRQIALWIQEGKPSEGHYASFALWPMRYDMTLAHQYLGFHSAVPLLDGLEEMIEAALPQIGASNAAGLPQQSWQRRGFPQGRGSGWPQWPRAGGQWGRPGGFGSGFGG